LWQPYRINTPRKDGGLGRLSYPLLSDLNHQIAKDYGVLLENEGHTLRYMRAKSLLYFSKVPP
jgi:peroxiredoxin (alkyl hydroperoxide reductase subunit C)